MSAATRLGGQALLAQLLPARAEFGGIVTNLTREAERSGARMHQGATTVTPDSLVSEAPDAVILAPAVTCRSARRLEIGEGAHIIHAVRMCSRGEPRPAHRVVIYDWLADWIGLGIAEKLAERRRPCPPRRQRAHAPAWRSRTIRAMRILPACIVLGVKIIPLIRLYGADAPTAYFVHTAAQEPVVLEDVDTIVLACPNAPEDTLTEAAEGFEHYLIGDCLAARTAEEAVYEGLKAGMAV